MDFLWDLVDFFQTSLTVFFGVLNRQFLPTNHVCGGECFGRVIGFKEFDEGEAFDGAEIWTGLIGIFRNV